MNAKLPKISDATQRVPTAVMIVAFAFALQLHADPRTSTNYTVPTDTTDAGGKRATSAAYTNDGSAGALAGISPLSPHLPRPRSTATSASSPM